MYCFIFLKGRILNGIAIFTQYNCKDANFRTETNCCLFLLVLSRARYYSTTPMVLIPIFLSCECCGKQRGRNAVWQWELWVTPGDVPLETMLPHARSGRGWAFPDPPHSSGSVCRVWAHQEESSSLHPKVWGVFFFVCIWFLGREFSLIIFLCELFA